MRIASVPFHLFVPDPADDSVRDLLEIMLASSHYAERLGQPVLEFALDLSNVLHIGVKKKDGRG